MISADDYGYAPAYDRGILEAADAGALDAVSVMVARRRPPDVRPLLRSGVELGLHLELTTLPPTEATAGEAERRAALTSLSRQLEAFGELFGRNAAFLDGHHHCHALPGLAALIGRAAADRGLPTRSIDARHRRLLRSLGVPTPDLLVGRLREDRPALPPELEPLLVGEPASIRGVVEWMVHPGHPDASAGSAYDAGREQDLRLLGELLESGPLRRLRATHAAALAR